VISPERQYEVVVTSRLHKRAESNSLAGAVITWAGESAINQARALDTLAARGEALPNLAGLIMSVKANVDVTGWTTSAGSRVLEDEPAAKNDAPLVAALRRSGAIFLAQTNMVEFAYGALGQNSSFGTPRTPVYPDEIRLTGGSSSGAAVTVAVGLVDAAIGTDTSGSVRIPAAFCGVAGFKPTQGRYSDKGIVPLAPSLDTAGFLAPSIAVCDRLDAAITARDYDARPPAPVKGMRFVVPRAFIEQHSAPTVANAFDRALAKLTALGASVEDKDMAYLDDIGELARQGGIVSAEAFVWHEPYISTRAILYDSRIGPRIAAGANIRAVDYIRACENINELRARYNSDIAGFTAQLMPTAPVEPPLLSVIANDELYLQVNMQVLKFTEFANRINVPSLSIPIGGPTVAIGLMANGRRGEDAELLMIGRQIEGSLGLAESLGGTGQ